MGRLDFDAPLEPIAALRFAVEGLSRYSVNFHNPRYFGLFDPAPATMGLIGNPLAAAFNPQLTAWLASPFAIEAEAGLLREFGTRFGLSTESTDGTLTRGSAEAMRTAVLPRMHTTLPGGADARASSAACPARPVPVGGRASVIRRGGGALHNWARRGGDALDCRGAAP